MRKAKSSVADELRPEYRRDDLGKGVRGKYYAAHQKRLESRAVESRYCQSIPDLGSGERSAPWPPASYRANREAKPSFAGARRKKRGAPVSFDVAASQPCHTAEILEACLPMVMPVPSVTSVNTTS